MTARCLRPPFSSRRSRERVALLAAAFAAVVMLAPVAPGGATTPKVVGQVIAVGGTKRLQTRDVAAGPLHRLQAQDDVVLGEEVVMGAGVTATLRVARPKGVSPDVDLIDLRPVAGTQHNVVVSREGADTIIKIRPA